MYAVVASYADATMRRRRAPRAMRYASLMMLHAD